MESPIDALLKLIENLKRTQNVELDCEGVFAVLDIYAEAKAQGLEPQDLLPLVRHHLEICRDCLEEYEALLRILEKTGS